MEKQKSLLAIILLFCLVNLTAATAAPYQVDEALTDEVHLLPDVSFESDEAGGLPSGWSSIHTDSVAVFDSLDEALHGSKSIRIEPSAGSQGTTRRVRQLTAGKRYLFSANIKITGDDGVGFIVVLDRATRAILGSERVSPGAYQSWQKLVTEFVAQSDQVVLSLSVRGNTGPAFFDIVKLQQADTVLGSGSFEDGAEQWELVQNASIQSTESLLGEHSLVLANNHNSDLAYASRTILLGPTDNEKSFKLMAAIKMAPTVDGQMIDFLLNAWTWLVEPFTRMFVCNQETDWLDNPLDDITITNRDVPEIEGNGAGFQVRVYSADESKFRDISAPLFYSKSNAFHEREFYFLVPHWARKMVVTAVNRKSDSTASFDNIRLSASAVPENQYLHEVGARFNPVEAPLPGSFLAPHDIEEIQSAVDQVADPLSVNCGKIVWVDSGLYRGDGIDLWSNVHLKMHWRARMRRTEDPISPFGFASGFFRSCNNSFPGSTRLHDIVVEGGWYLSNQKQGSAIAIAANRVIIRNMTIPTWSRKGENDPAAYQVSAMFLFGNDFSVHNNFVSGPTSNIESEFVFPGYDGIHIWGGTGASLMNNQIRAGDDGIGLFPLTQFEVDVAGFPIFPVHHYNYNISDVEVYNNLLDSHGARTVGIGLPFPRQSERRMTCEVKNIRVRNFRGKCGGGQSMVNVMCAPALPNNDLPFDSIPEAQVSNVLIEKGFAFGDFSIINQAPFHGPIKEYGIQFITSDVGSLKGIQIRDLRIRDATTYGIAMFRATSGGIPNENIDIRDCIIDVLNDQAPDLPHRSFFIHQIEPGEVNSDIESANRFFGNPGQFMFD